MRTDRPRILIDALSVAGGGGHSYAVNLIKELDRDDRGFRFTFLVPPGRLAEIPTQKVKLRSVGLFGSQRPLGVTARIFYEELVLPIRALRHDVVYAVADIASPLLPVPTIVALRNLNIYDHTYYDTFRLRILERLVRLGLRPAARMLFPTGAAARLIGGRLGLAEEVVRIVPHGVDAESFTRVPGIEGGAPYLFLPAAVERHKNLEVLIDAIPHLADSELEIRIAGTTSTDPAYVSKLKNRARRLGVEHRFRLLGPVPYERIVAFYRGSFALVFPSMLETFGHPMLEAMLAGTPIVASDIPAFQEIGNRVALFFPPDDPVALAEAINETIENRSATEERILRGHERAAMYSWRRSTDMLCAVFREVLGD